MKKITVEKFEAITLRVEYSGRGGGIAITLDRFRVKGLPKGGRMSAYQNYLGGGMLGKIEASSNVKDWRNNEKLVAISEQLKEYFYNLTHEDEDEDEDEDEFDYNNRGFEENQNMPVSAY